MILNRMLTLIMICLLLTSCADFHNEDLTTQQQCANLRNEMAQYQSDLGQMRTMTINRNYRDMQTSYQQLGCTSLGDHLGFFDH